MDMNIATHLVKIKGTVKDGKNREKELRDYVKEKIYNDVDSIYHPDLERFHIDKDDTIEIWVYVSGFVVTKKIVGQWLQDHIKEEGIDVREFEIEKLENENVFILIN